MMINTQLEAENCSLKRVLTELELLLNSPGRLGGERLGGERRQLAGCGRRHRHDSARDSGAEVSEDEEAAPGGGPPLVEAVMATLRRLCSRLLLSPHTDVKHVSHFVSLLDSCLARDCYTQHHRQLLASWRHKLTSIWSTSRQQQRLHHRHQHGHQEREGRQERRDLLSSPLPSFPISHWRGVPSSQTSSQGSRDQARKRLSLQTESPGVSASLQHRYSLPLFGPVGGGDTGDSRDKWSPDPPGADEVETEDEDTELDSRLECLCISVTETALTE